MPKKTACIILIFLYLFATGCSSFETGSVITGVARAVTKEILDAEAKKRKCERCCKDCTWMNAESCKDCGCGCGPEKFYKNPESPCRKCTEFDKGMRVAAGGALIAGGIVGLVIGLKEYSYDSSTSRFMPGWIGIPLFTLGFAAVASLPFMLISGIAGDRRPCCDETWDNSIIREETVPAGTHNPTDDIRNQYYWDPVENVYKRKK